MPPSLPGLTALVTGAGVGLGRSIAQAYLAAGANVVVCDINKDRLAAASTEWGNKHGDKFFPLEADVSNEASVSKLLSETVTKFGSLDVLVNNAGVMDKFEPIGSTDKATWDRIVGVNLTGTFLTTKAAVHQFEKQGEEKGGIIINIGSNASFMGLCAGAAYTASKHGVMALTKNTAGFYGTKGIYSMALLLGGMDQTNITDAFAMGISQEGMARVTGAHPGFVPGHTSVPTEDVAKYILFLSDRSIAASSNGACIPFNKNWPEA